MSRDSFVAGNLFSVQGRNALITGATSGIGYMMAEALIINGVETLFITGNDNEDVIQEKVSALQNLANTSGGCKVLGSVYL
jgi:NAD(P)-dependent dehydrogenase (short-subunit alcohol dehydrogenase family)